MVQPQAAFLTKPWFIANIRDVRETNPNIWCCLVPNIFCVASAHHLWAPQGHPRSVTSVDLTHALNNLFGASLVFFSAGGFEYDAFMWSSSIRIPHWPVHVEASSYDVNDLTYDVIRVTVHDLWALCALNIRPRYTKSTSSCAELRGEQVDEGSMTLS